MATMFYNTHCEDIEVTYPLAPDASPYSVVVTLARTANDPTGAVYSIDDTYPGRYGQELLGDAGAARDTAAVIAVDFQQSMARHHGCDFTLWACDAGDDSPSRVVDGRADSTPRQGGGAWAMIAPNGDLVGFVAYLPTAILANLTTATVYGPAIRGIAARGYFTLPNLTPWEGGDY